MKSIAIVALVLSLSAPALAVDAVLKIRGEVHNYLYPQYLESHPEIIQQIKKEAENNPDIPIAKNLNKLKEAFRLLMEDAQANPDAWDVGTDYYRAFNDAGSRLANKGVIDMNMRWGVISDLYNFFYSHPEQFENIKNGTYDVTNYIGYFAYFLFSGEGPYNVLSRIFGWGLEFPIIIDGEAYMATVDSPVQSLGSYGMMPEYLIEGAIRVAGLPEDFKPNGKLLLFNSPFEVFQKERTLPISQGCLHKDENSPMKMSTLQANVEEAQTFSKCLGMYPSTFKQLNYSLKEKEKPNNELYPEFHEIFKPEKDTINLLIMSSKGSGFGFSNFMNLSLNYSNKYRGGPHGGSDSEAGDFKKIFESKNDNVIQSSLGISAIGQRRVVLESKSFGESPQKFRIHLVYQESNYDEIYQALARDMDMVVYQGHSGYGGNLEGVIKIPYKEKTYQAMFVLACNSMGYVSNTYALAKGILDFDMRGTYWDFIGSRSASPLWNSGDVLKVYIDFYFEAFKAYHTGKSLSHLHYGHLLDKMNKADRGVSQWAANGIQTNHWKPNQDNRPLREVGRDNDKGEGINMAFRVLLSNQDPAIHDQLNARLKNRNYVSSQEYQTTLGEFLDSPYNAEDQKNRLRDILGIDR